MRGTDRHTGQPLNGLAHLRQSVNVILTTPIGSRLMNREFGSRIFDYVDRSSSQITVIDIIAAAAEALDRWEPRIDVKRIELDNITPGSLAFSVVGLYRNTGERVEIEVNN